MGPIWEVFLQVVHFFCSVSLVPVRTCEGVYLHQAIDMQCSCHCGLGTKIIGTQVVAL
jgi:hypothetical protein